MFISKYKIYIPLVDHSIRKKSINIANAMALELMAYGVVADKVIIDRLSRLKFKDAADKTNEILTHFTVGELNKPLFVGWENRTEFTFSELITQIMGYTIQLSGNDLYDPDYLDSLKDKIDFKKFKKLSLVSDSDAEKHLKAISGVRQNKEQQKTAVELSKHFELPADEFIQSDDARVAAILAKGLDSIFVMKTKPADILRFFAMRKDVEQGILPSDVKYDLMTWQERKKSIGYLSGYDPIPIMEAMGLNRTAWIRFFKHIHLFKQESFRLKYPEFIACAWISVGSKLDKTRLEIKREVEELIKQGLVDVTEEGNLAYRTFASRMQSAIESKDYSAIEKLSIERPSYLLRNIATVSNGVKKKHYLEFRTLCRKSLEKASINVLFSILQIDVNSEYRIIDVKGDTIVDKANYSPVIRDIQGDVEHEIYQRHGVKGKIKVAKNLRNRIVPFLARNQSIDRGTKILFEKERYLHFFIHWIQTDKTITDLDHSHLIFKRDGTIENIAFYNQANQYISQSGDITNAPAPNGATEYSVFDLQNIPDDVLYIAPIINVYSGDVFKVLPESYAGFMFNTESEFNINRKHTRYDLDQPAEMNLPFVIDVVNKKIIIVDYNSRSRHGNIAADYANKVMQVVNASQTLNKLTIERFADILSSDEIDEVAFTIKENPNGFDVAPSELAGLVE